MSRFLNALRVDNTVDSSWISFFTKQEVINHLKFIENKLIGNYTPCDSKVLRFATVDLNKVKIVIIGIDPYPQKGVATGRSFEVSNIIDWNDKGLNKSLKNILKLIHKSEFNLPKEKSIDEVRKDINNGKFLIKKPNEVFEYWENQGVLFLNSAFTCEVGKSETHIEYWNKFFCELLKYICEENKNIKYFLWGKARKYEGILQNKNDGLYKSDHPVATNSKDYIFLESKCFLETKNIIKWV